MFSMLVVAAVAAITFLDASDAFTPRATPDFGLPSVNQRRRQETTTSLAALYSPRRSTATRGRDAGRSKRQHRVGQLVQTELGRIIQSGNIKGSVKELEFDLRNRISIVSVNMSPDLRQARVAVSVRKDRKAVDESSDPNANPIVDQRRAYSWLVQNCKPIRHTLAQRMSHMKSSPELTFVQVDVSAAVDVMYLIDKISQGYERETIGAYGETSTPSLTQGYHAGMDFDGEFEEDDWEDEDDDFFLDTDNSEQDFDSVVDDDDGNDE